MSKGEIIISLIGLVCLISGITLICSHLEMPWWESASAGILLFIGICFYPAK